MAGMNPYLPSYRRLCFVPVSFFFQHIYCFLENSIRRENERVTGLFDRNIRYDSLLINNPSGSRPVFSNGNFQCFPISIGINGLYRSLAIACLPDDDAFFLVLHRTGQNLRSAGAVPVYQDSHGHGVFNSFNGEIFTPLMPGMVADHCSACQNLVCHSYYGVNHSTGVHTQVNDKFFTALVFQRRKLLLKLFRRVSAESEDMDIAYMIVHHTA